jgi:hypothetical protein
MQFAAKYGFDEVECRTPKQARDILSAFLNTIIFHRAIGVKESMTVRCPNLEFYYSSTGTSSIDEQISNGVSKAIKELESKGETNLTLGFYEEVSGGLFSSAKKEVWEIWEF